MNICIIGAGYVGLVTGAGLAQLGHHVQVVDTDEAKIRMLQKCKNPIHEPGLDELLRNMRLSFHHTEEYVPGDEVFFIAVGTPPMADGAADLKYVFSASEWIAYHASKDAPVIIKSTVPPGTAMRLRRYLPGRMIVSNPEFLAEGTAVDDFQNPDRIVIGCKLEETADALKLAHEIYGEHSGYEPRLMLMRNESAELAKYASNGMLATRISFMNEVARISLQVGAEVRDVQRVVGSDSRIGSNFLSPGPGWGGSCFPKDVAALARHDDASPLVVESALRSNEVHKAWISQRILGMLQSPEKAMVTIWGLAFKAGTDDTRDSPALQIIENLIGQGVTVVVYDPHAAMPNPLLPASERILYSDDLLESVGNSDLLVVLTPCREFIEAPFDEVAAAMRTPDIFDTRNCLHRALLSKSKRSTRVVRL